MSRPRLTSVITCIPLVAGCSSYHYMRDVTPELQTSRQEYVVNNPGNHFNDDIEAGRVRKGMSRLQVRSTWGDPDQLTHRTTNAETWAYQETDPGRGTSVFHLLFTGELLTEVDVEHFDTALPTTADSPLSDTKQELPTGTSSTTSTGKRLDGLLR